MKEPTVVLVGTWNLENLFRPGSEFGASDEPAYEAKLAALAGVVNRLAPDVLAVQEVGDPEALDDLVDSLDGDWETETSTVFDAHHPIRVGVLSRLPLSDVAGVVEEVRVDVERDSDACLTEDA